MASGDGLSGGRDGEGARSEASRPEALDARFVHRSLFVILAAGAVYLAWQLSSVLLLVVAAVVVAVLLRAIGDGLARRTPIPAKPAVGVAAILVLAAVGAGLWLFGSVLAGQFGVLAADAPAAAAQIHAALAGLPFGDSLAGEFAKLQQLPNLHGLAGRIGTYAMGAVGVIGNLVVVVFTGFFLALEPEPALNGLVRLFPDKARPRLRKALEASGRALRLWLLGILVDMAATGVLTGLGAWVLGLSSPLALGLVAALFDFVPIVGPIASIVPGLVIAAPQGASAMLWTGLMYLAVQQVEGNVIYPLIQRRAVDIPPFLSLMTVVAAGVLFGALGVILATPLLVVGLTWTKVLYLRQSPAGDDPQAGAEPHGGRDAAGHRSRAPRADVPHWLLSPRVAPPSGSPSDGVDPAGARAQDPEASPDGYARALRELGREGPQSAARRD